MIRCTAASASLPATSISPMWLTSNSPARVRTAMCSSTMPEYSTGMSHPPNSTILAPRARCRACSGVFLRVRTGAVSSDETGEPAFAARAGRHVSNGRYYAAQSGVKEDSRHMSTHRRHA